MEIERDEVPKYQSANERDHDAYVGCPGHSVQVHRQACSLWRNPVVGGGIACEDIRC